MKVRYAKRPEGGPDRLNLLGLWCPLGEWVEASDVQARKASFLVGTFELEKTEVAGPPVETEQAVLEPKKQEHDELEVKRAAPPLHGFRRGPGRPRKA
jgi:hypothetical protein